MTEQQVRPLISSELFAISQGTRCEGDQECHWCAAPCERKHIHDDPPPILGVKRNYSARRPGNSWICEGCRLWRAPSTTIQFLHGGFKDRRGCMLHSWWVTESSAWALTFESASILYPKLLAPPKKFMLAVLANNICSGSLDDKVIRNHLQHCVVNDFKEVQADSPIQFTVNNVVHTYTIYELEDALQNGLNGKSGGVREIVSMFGTFKLPEKEARGRGRPPETPDGKITKKKIKGED